MEWVIALQGVLGVYFGLKHGENMRKKGFIDGVWKAIDDVEKKTKLKLFSDGWRKV